MNICAGCGKLMESRFFYCPWCGKSRINEDTEDSMELRYQRYRQMQNEKQLEKMARMSEELDQLEEELCNILVKSPVMCLSK